MGVADGARTLPCISLSERCLFATQARAKGGLNVDVWSTGGGPGLERSMWDSSVRGSLLG